MVKKTAYKGRYSVTELKIRALITITLTKTGYPSTIITIFPHSRT